MSGKFQSVLSVSVVVLGLMAPSSDAAAGYWDTDIPIMSGSSNVRKSKDREKASIQANYDLLVEDYRAPLRFYGRAFESTGWKHHISEAYEKFPNQFKRPPGEDWSSFVAASQDGSYRIAFGSMWQNKAYGANVTLKMTLTGIEGNAMKAHIDIVVAPPIDGSAFLELFEATRSDPKALLQLAQIAGGDPFKLETVDIKKVRSLTTRGRLTSLYLKAIDSVMAQIADFSAKQIPPE